MSYSEFKAAYIETLLWSEIDYGEDGIEDGNFDGEAGSLAPEALIEIERDCRDFYDAQAELIAHRPHHAGHDFCLTRNGHGAGFWDGDWPDDTGKALTDASRPYGTQGLYRGDDGLIYTHG